MADEQTTQGSAQPQGQPPAQNTPNPQIPIEQTPAERFASEAMAHTSQAADALRKGELMQNSEIDPLADSDDRLIALLSYLTQIVIPVIMPIIVLLSESSKKRPFQRYHAMQSLAFTVLFWSLIILTTFGLVIIQIIPFIGQLIAFMFGCLMPFIWFAQALLLIYYGFQAYKGRRFAIPGLTSFLRDQNWL